ncbi:MAG: AbrB/MazE/SpoVT family DNA-binding domain-containing protein [Candidatus Binataceae bacterium]
MATATKIGPKFQVVIPKQIRQAARLRVGDYVEATLTREGIVLRPKALIDRDLERDLEEALEDIKAGRVYGPYDASEAVRALHKAIKSERNLGAGEKRRAATSARAKHRARPVGNARDLQR